MKRQTFGIVGSEPSCASIYSRMCLAISSRVSRQDAKARKGLQTTGHCPNPTAGLAIRQDPILGGKADRMWISLIYQRATPAGQRQTAVARAR